MFDWINLKIFANKSASLFKIHLSYKFGFKELESDIIPLNKQSCSFSDNFKVEQEKLVQLTNFFSMSLSLIIDDAFPLILYLLVHNT